MRLMAIDSDIGGGTVRGNPAYPAHHIDDDMLLAYAAGTLGEAAGLVVAAHLSLCPRCRAGVLTAEVVGGTLLDDISPQDLSSTRLDEAMARLDNEPPPVRSSRLPPRARAAFGAQLPQPILDYMPDDVESLRWSWVSPGVKFAALLTDDDGARVGLMRTLPGAAITQHGHSGDELTLVLSGGFTDAGSTFRRGDVQAVDETTTHEPVTDQKEACLSLVMIQGPVKPTRWIARIFRHFTEF